MSISKTAIIYPNVELGKNVTIEDYCIIGQPAKSSAKITKIGDNATIRSHSVIYSGNIIGKNFQTGNKANIREENIIGDNVSIGTLSVIEHNVKIEDNVRIHSQAFIPEYCILEEGCWIGPNVVLTNAKYPNSKAAKNKLAGPTIKRKAMIGANSTILPEVIISEKTLIGAGSLVKSNTEPESIYVGNPAKFLKKITEVEDYENYTSM